MALKQRGFQVDELVCDLPRIDGIGLILDPGAQELDAPDIDIGYDGVLVWHHIAVIQNIVIWHFGSAPDLHIEVQSA